MKQVEMIDKALELAQEAVALGYLDIAEQALDIATKLRRKAAAAVERNKQRTEALH